MTRLVLLAFLLMTGTAHATTLFADEFTGPAGPPNRVWTTYPWAPEGAVAGTGTVQLDGRGHLLLRVDNASQSAAIWTRDTHRVQPPFRLRARVKYPATSYEVWHSWWWNNGAGELDVYENGGLTYRYQAAAHVWDGSTHVSAQVTQCPIDYDPRSAFHWYEAAVSSGSVTFSHDGVVCATVPVNPEAFKAAGWLNLNLWPNSGFMPRGFPAVLTVDRVEVLAD